MKLSVTTQEMEAKDAKKAALPDHAVESLRFRTPRISPAIRSLLLILSYPTLSTATTKRFFSVLKLIKTCLCYMFIETTILNKRKL